MVSINHLHPLRVCVLLGYQLWEPWVGEGETLQLRPEAVKGKHQQLYLALLMSPGVDDSISGQISLNMSQYFWVLNCSGHTTVLQPTCEKTSRYNKIMSRGRPRRVKHAPEMSLWYGVLEWPGSGSACGFFLLKGSFFLPTISLCMLRMKEKFQCNRLVSLAWLLLFLLAPNELD